MVDNKLDEGLLAAVVARQIEQAEFEYSHASLLYRPDVFPYCESLKKLSNAAAGRPVKPNARFVFGRDTRFSPWGLFADLTKCMPDDRSKWNVHVMVYLETALIGFDPQGWNHSKLDIRDGVEVLSSSFETGQFESAIHLGGRPAAIAQEWFGTRWNLKTISQNPQRHNCVSSRGACTSFKLHPRVALPAWPNRAANVFAIRRGAFSNTPQYEGDKALLAAIRAAQQSVFVLNPGLVIEAGAGYQTDDVSAPLVDALSTALVQGRDVKFVWGDHHGHILTPAIWSKVDRQMQSNFVNAALTPQQRQLAHCSLHVSNYAPPSPGSLPLSHAKIYMMDRAFYVGSQNSYPSGIVSGYIGPELYEFGFLVDSSTRANPDLSGELSAQMQQVWDASIKDSPASSSEFAECRHFPMPAVMEAVGQTSTGLSVRCDAPLNLELDFRNVSYAERAKVQGTGACLVDGSEYVMDVDVSGSILTNNNFQGTIRGTLRGHGVTDQAPLTGTFRKGAFSWSFSGLSLGHGVSVIYSGTLRNTQL